MEARRDEDGAEFRQTLRRRWRLGGEDFLGRLQDRMTESSNENHDPQQVGEAMEVRASKMITEELQRCKLHAGKSLRDAQGRSCEGSIGRTTSSGDARDSPRDSLGASHGVLEICFVFAAPETESNMTIIRSDPHAFTLADRSGKLDETVRRSLGAKAREHHAYLVVSFNLSEDDGTVSNATVLFDRQGKVAGIYRKVFCLSAADGNSVEGGKRPGTEFPVFDTDFGRIGMLICYDMGFEDGFEAYAREGVDMVVWPEWHELQGVLGCRPCRADRSFSSRSLGSSATQG